MLKLEHFVRREHGLDFPGGSDSKESACKVSSALDWKNSLEKGMAIHSSKLA